MEKAIKNIPKSFIYEEFEGIPIYRKGFRDVLLGLKTIEEVNMGTSRLQWFITLVLTKFLNSKLAENYLIGSGELGLHISQKSNFAADIAIYSKETFSVDLNSTKYADSPPKIVIEVDIKMDTPDSFQSEDDYLKRKTEKLLEFGVEKVIWVFTSSQRVLIADNMQRWSYNSWDIPFEVLDGVEANIWELMLENGFQV